MINPNCTLFIPQQSSEVTTDALGNLVPAVGTALEVRAWLHEINQPRSEQQPGVERDTRLLRGHTIGYRPASLQTGQSIKISFDNGVEGTLQLQDRVLGDPEMLRFLSGDQIQGIFRDNTQR